MGISQSISSLIAGIGPLLCGAIWTLTVEDDFYLSSYIMYWFLSLVAAGLAAMTFLTPSALNVPFSLRQILAKKIN